MVLPLVLVLGLSLGQAPDFLDVQAGGGGYQVLGGGGLLYRWSGQGDLMLEAQLGSPAAALFTCEDRHTVAVGPKGQVHESTSGLAWRHVTVEGTKDLWAVAGAGCGRVLIAGDGGLWQGTLDGEPLTFNRVPLPLQRPLYGVAVERERAVAVGAGGTVLLQRGASGPFVKVSTGTEAPLLSVALLGGERYGVAGAGGMWLGNADTLRQVYVDESEVFSRVVFADARVGVALGQEKVLVTTDGGERWRVLPRAHLLGAVPLGGGRFLAVGSEGAWTLLDTAEPESGPTPKLKVTRRLVPEEKQPRKKPEPPSGKPEVEVTPLPPIALVEPPPPPDPKCLLSLDRKNMAGAFLDVKRVGAQVFVASSDGTLRRAEGNALPVVHEAGDPLLGIAVSPDGSEVTATGYGVLVRSEDGGQTFRTERAPSDALFYAAAFAGKALLVFDAQGRGWRSVKGGPFEPLPLPRVVAYYGASFADERRGYVVGECGTLLETLDGGANWTVLPAPDASGLQGVLAWGDTLYVSGEGGVWRSDDRGRTFRSLLSELSCVRLARQGRAVAAACAGGMGTVLRYAADGRTFRPVSVPYSHALMSVELLGSGEILAVGVREQFIRARPSGGTLAYGSKAVQEWRAFIDENQRRKKQAPPRDPPRRVPVTSLPAR